MNPVIRHPPTKRAAAAELMRGTDWTTDVIAQRIGVPPSTIARWNQTFNWRPWVPRTPPAANPKRWSQARRDALERIYRMPNVDLGDLALAAGGARERADTFFRACGFPEKTPLPEPERVEGQALRRSLRSHVARQIADLDAELSLRRAKPSESARMLRDLAGLKRLIDEIDDDEAAAQAAEEAAEAYRLTCVAAMRAKEVSEAEAFFEEYGHWPFEGDAEAEAPDETAAVPEPSIHLI